ncbi:unnamed protein product [Klebsiella pneumoniae]|nr:unnamed protein product [Klebsiella pneumoniae]
MNIEAGVVTEFDAVPESTVVDWQDHILNLPDRAR